VRPSVNTCSSAALFRTPVEADVSTGTGWVGRYPTARRASGMRYRVRGEPPPGYWDGSDTDRADALYRRMARRLRCDGLESTGRVREETERFAREHGADVVAQLERDYDLEEQDSIRIFIDTSAPISRGDEPVDAPAEVPASSLRASATTSWRPGRTLSSTATPVRPSFRTIASSAKGDRSARSAASAAARCKTLLYPSET